MASKWVILPLHEWDILGSLHPSKINGERNQKINHFQNKIIWTIHLSIFGFQPLIFQGVVDNGALVPSKIQWDLPPTDP